MAKPRGPKSDAAAAAAKLEADAVEAKRRNFVETSASWGMPAAEIGLLMDPVLSEAEVQARYAVELERGPAKANFETVAKLREGVQKGNMTAIIWWTKSRMGWKENSLGEKVKQPAAPDDATGPSTAETGELGQAAATLGASIHKFPSRP